MQNVPATKEDIANLRAEIGLYKTYLDGALSKNTGDLILWVFLMQFGMVGMFLAWVGFFVL